MPLPFDRLFSMGAFEGLRALRQQVRMAPDVALPEIIQIVRGIDADAASLDLDAALELHAMIATAAPADGPPFYQACIRTLLLDGDHNWGRMITLGRTFFARRLDRDKLSVFTQAGLMIEPPTDEIVTWWDATAAALRFEADAVRNARARSAEKLTMNHETNRLRGEGRDENPRWMAVEDNTAGYDVESYEVTQYGLNRLAIEVKSCNAKPLEFHVSREEWKKALELSPAYLFYVWDIRQEPPALHVRTVAQVAPHIPQNQQDGEWKTVIIPVGGD
jgi:hypothetical protein